MSITPASNNLTIKQVSGPSINLGSANSLSREVSGNNDNPLNGMDPIPGAFDPYRTPLYDRVPDAAAVGGRINGELNKLAWGDAASKSVSSASGANSINGANSVNGRNISPDAYDKFGPGGINGYYGQGFFNQFPQRNFQQTTVPADSALNKISEVDTHKLWNGVRSNLIGGVFTDDQHLNTALNSTLDKFGGTDSKFQEAIRNADSLSIATAFNLSEKGIQERGIGSMMEAYSKTDNYIPEGMITRAYLDDFKEKLREPGGTVAEALKHAQRFDIKDHGYTDPNVSSDDTKALAHTINEATYKDMATSMGLNPDKLLQDYAKNGFNEENSLYQLSGAQHLAATLDGNLTKIDANGKTGFQNLVDASEKQHGGKFSGDLNLSILNSSNNKTDGEAFASSEGGLSGMASLIKHTAGLTDNPVAGNHFNLAYQGDAEKAKVGTLEFIQKGHEAGIEFDRINMTVKGHGSEDGSTMLKSGVIGDDYRGMGVQDSAYFEDILRKTPELKELNITYDSCFGLKSAQANAQAANQAAKDLGMNIKVNFTGSQIEGLVDTHKIHKNNDGYGMVKANSDGGLSVSHQRIDDGGSQKSGTLYSQGEEAYAQRMRTEQNTIDQPKKDTQPVKPVEEPERTQL